MNNQTGSSHSEETKGKKMLSRRTGNSSCSCAGKAPKPKLREKLVLKYQQCLAQHFQGWDCSPGTARERISGKRENPVG